MEILYGKLKTYEMEQEQRQIIYGPGIVDSKNTNLLKTTTLVVKDVAMTETRIEKPIVEEQEFMEAKISENSSRR